MLRFPSFALSSVASKTLLLALAALLLVLPASAQYFGRNKVNYDDFDFRVLETDHFEIYYYPDAEQAVRDAARMAERWYERHAQLFLHRFDERKPIILYANDADFQQTNVTEGTIGEGVGGFTESVRERVVMPLTGHYGATDHVLGHELVHSFQYDLAFNADEGEGMNLNLVPLWLVEGMAEYLTLGRNDPHTAMWMRDAALRDDLPTIKDLNNPRTYFPYRYGQAVLAYLGGTYGDQSVANLYRLSGRVGVDSAFVYLFGRSPDAVSAEWAQVVKDAYLPLVADRTPASDAGRRVLAKDVNGGRLNVAPVLSPDGRYVAFLSERDLFDISLYVADTRTGEVIASLGSLATEPDLDAIRFISSAGSWDPAGRRLAFVSFAKGDNEISIWNLASGDVERSFRVEGVTALSNPTWSPDGRSIAFSGLDGGISDLYVLNLESRSVRQLTNDRYADLQPTWSPDGQTLAFTTDRASLDLGTLRTGSTLQLATIDANGGPVVVREPFPSAHHHNPQFSPDGRSLYFVSSHDGFKDVYRQVIAADAPDASAIYRVTRLQTGVSGITANSPAMSVARQSGDLMFSVYTGGEYVGVALDASDARGVPLDAIPPSASVADTADVDTADVDTADVDTADVDTADVDTADVGVTGIDTTGIDTGRVTVPVNGPPLAGVLPPFSAVGEGLVEAQINDALTGLPDGTEFTDARASRRLGLEGIFPPTVGVSVGGPLGTGVAGGVGLRFGDVLGNQRLDVILQANGTFRDIGGGASYLNRGNRLNWAVSGSHIPVIIGQGLVATSSGFNLVTERVFITQASVSGIYPLNTTRRFEVGVGGVRYGFGTNVRGPSDDILGDVFTSPDTEYFGQTSFAYVVDYTDFGLTSPVRGARYRLQVAPLIGTASFVNVLADARRYVYARPFTVALQGVHVGNYGAQEDDLFGEEYLGSVFSPGFIRGYSFRSYELDDCTSSNCTNDFDRLIGTRIAKVSAEFRVPVLGVEPLSLVTFPYLPTEIALFTDVGVAWTQDDFIELDFVRDATTRSTPVASAGVALRFNVLGGFILEPYWAYAFQRPNDPTQWGLRFQPGW